MRIYGHKGRRSFQEGPFNNHRNVLLAIADY